MSPTATRKRTRDAERSKAAILAAAREEFVLRGFSGARTSHIARGAGVPQGLLYHYFAGKEALFHAVMDDVMAPYFQSTIDLLEHPPTGRSDEMLLETAIRMYFRFLRENPQVARLMGWWTANAEFSGPLVSDDVELCRRPMELGALRIQEAQEAGIIRPELDPRSVIRTFLDLCMTWHQNWEARAREDGIDPADATAADAFHRRQEDHIVSMVLCGVLTPDARKTAPREGN
jgi:AcrR family transcriptional regulator